MKIIKIISGLVILICLAGGLYFATVDTPIKQTETVKTLSLGSDAE